MRINNETKAGILVVVTLLGLGIITWKAGGFDFRPDGYRLKAHFKNIDGVALNAPVTVNGFEVGRVEDIRMLYDKDVNVEVVLWIDTKARIRRDARVVVKNLGFMGEKYIGITSGDGAADFLNPDEVVRGQDPGSFEKVMSEAEGVASNIKEISANINKRLKINGEKIDAIVEDLRLTMANVKNISGNIDERLTVNKLLLDDIVFQLNASSRNLEDLSYDLKLNPWKLMYKEPKKVERAKPKSPAPGGEVDAVREQGDQ